MIISTRVEKMAGVSLGKGLLCCGNVYNGTSAKAGVDVGFLSAPNSFHALL